MRQKAVQRPTLATRLVFMGKQRVVANLAPYLAIDDFGTGATSIEQLRTFPFTELKIDGRFMMAGESDEFSRLTVETSAKLAGLLGMTVVAEGVETAAAILFARRSGADEVQGFYFAKPMDGVAAQAWLQAHELNGRRDSA